MREGQPSTTARLVSFARGMGLAAEPVDPLAGRLLPRVLGALLEAGQKKSLRPYVRDASRFLTLGFVDHVTLRTMAIDRAVERAVAGGVRQCVILGAGLDTRAHRLRALCDVRTFELDHPATQVEKRRRMAAAGLDREGLTYVPIDFGRAVVEAGGDGAAPTTVSDVLEAAGHDAGSPTMWIWEGVTMYLPLEATRGTLAEVARRSAPSSELALTYFVPGSIPLGAVGESTVRFLFRTVGEPLEDGFSKAAMGALLDEFGFERRSDTSSATWANDAGALRDVPMLYRGERLALATFRGGVRP